MRFNIVYMVVEMARDAAALLMVEMVPRVVHRIIVAFGSMVSEQWRWWIGCNIMSLTTVVVSKQII